VGGAGLSNSALLASNGEILTDVEGAATLPPGKVLRRDTQGQFALDLTDIPAIPQEPFAPPLESQIYQVNFYYTYTPSEKEFWQKEMSWWMRDVNQYIAPTPLLKSTAEEACSPTDTPLDKARKLYAVVQKLENIDAGRPTFYNGMLPRGSVDGVLQQKKGNSSELAFLYLALARTAGLNARPERIVSREHRIFSAQFLSTEQLDALVIGIAIDGKEITVDPGVKTAPFQTLFWSHAGAAGVALASNNKVETVMTPLAQNADNSVVRVGSLNLSAEGSVSGTLKVAFIGQQAIELRQIGLRSGAEAVKEEVNRMLAAQVPSGIEAHVDRIVNLEDSSKQLLAVVPVSGTLATHTGGRLIVPRLFFETRETNPFPAQDDRTLPVDVRYPSQDQEQITYVLPAGSTLEAKPLDTVMKWEENAAYQLRSKTDATSVTSARVLARGFTLLDAKEYAPLRDFYQKVVTTDQQQLVLTQTNKASQ
jgi:hypothetical protein